MSSQASRYRLRAVVAGTALALTAAWVLGALPASAVGCSPGTIKCFAANLSPGNVTAGSTDTFAMVITNESPASTTQQFGSANITAPLGFTLISVSPPSQGTATISGNVIQLRNVALPPQQSETFTFSAKASAVAGTYTWQIAAKQSNNFNGTGNDLTLDTTNSQLKTVVSAAPSADLAVSFGGTSGTQTIPAAQPEPATAGNRVLYTLTVTNNGPATESSVSLTESLTGGATFIQIPATGTGIAGSGSGWSCSLTSSTDASCGYGALASGASANLLQAWVLAPSSVTPTVCGSSSVNGICNMASVSGPQPDSNTSNNTGSHATVVNPASSCGTGSVSCGTSFIIYNQPSSVTTGTIANATQWLVGTASFPATSVSGGQTYTMSAASDPGTICPVMVNGAQQLTKCTFEMDMQVIPSPYVGGSSVTLVLHCDKSKCPLSAIPGSGTEIVKQSDSGGSAQIIVNCSVPGAGSLCFTTTLDGQGNLQVTVQGIVAGDPKIAGVCVPPTGTC